MKPLDQEVAEQQGGKGASHFCPDLLDRAHRWNGNDTDELKAIFDECNARMTDSSQEQWLALWEIPAVLLKTAGCPVSLGEALLFEFGTGAVELESWDPPSGFAC